MINISTCGSLTELGSTSEALELKRRGSISSPVNSSTAVPTHHALHHSLNQVLHRIYACPVSASVMSKGMSEKFVQTLSLEHLSKQLIWIEVSRTETTATLASFTSEHVIVLSFLTVTKTLVCLTDFLECILRSRCAVFVWMHLES